MASSTPVLLVIADISGYTRFMRRYSVVSSHAREITVRLLKAVISSSAYPLKVAEVEGDAVFFFAPQIEGSTPASTESVKRQLIALFRAFRAEVARLEAMDVCSCEACSSVGTLVLKQVVHAGEATIEKVNRFEKLFSLDVILVHRLLKNSVKGRRYVLLTSPAYRLFEPFFGLSPERHVEDVDGIGEVETVVFRGQPLDELIEADESRDPSPTWIERLLWRWRLEWSGFRSRFQYRVQPSESVS